MRPGARRRLVVRATYTRPRGRGWWQLRRAIIAWCVCPGIFLQEMPFVHPRWSQVMLAARVLAAFAVGACGGERARAGSASDSAPSASRPTSSTTIVDDFGDTLTLRT